MYKPLLAAALGVAVMTSPVAANHDGFRSQPFTEGEVVVMQIDGCDTEEHAMSALAEWATKGYAAFITWLRVRGLVERNAAGGTICGRAAGPMAPIRTVGEGVQVEYHGDTITIWIVEIMLPNGSRFFAFSAAPTQQPGRGA